MTSKKTSILLLITLGFNTVITAEDNNSTEKLKDMSDPLTVYTRGGI